jgi:hypothetical protein
VCIWAPEVVRVLNPQMQPAWVVYSEPCQARTGGWGHGGWGHTEDGGGWGQEEDGVKEDGVTGGWGQVFPFASCLAKGKT